METTAPTTHVGTEAAQPTGIAALGVNPSFLLIQIVNFLILLLVLSVVLYRPLLNLLRERREKIAEGLSLAERAKEDAAAADARATGIVTKAREEARAILETTRSQAEHAASATKQRAEEEAAALLERTRQQITAEKAALAAQVEAEAGILVVEAARQVIQQQSLELSSEEVSRAIEQAKGALS